MSPSTLPKRIEPCPIREAIAEIRFENKVPAAASIGILYECFKDKYPTLEELPILQLPEQIRNSDPNLKHQPTYKMLGENFILLAGTNSFGVSIVGEYCGWDIFLREILTCLQAVHNRKMVGMVTRFGLRYINTFSFDIFPKLTLSLKLDNQPLNSSVTNTLFQVPVGDFVHTLRLANNAEIKRENDTFQGSVIDIDTETLCVPDGLLLEPRELIESAHDEEKKLFFSLLGTELLESLNPEY